MRVRGVRFIQNGHIYKYGNMVITGVENWSPDMIPVAFEGKFDEKKDEIPPGIYRPHILEIFQYWELLADTKTQKWS